MTEGNKSYALNERIQALQKKLNEQEQTILEYKNKIEWVPQRDQQLKDIFTQICDYERGAEMLKVAEVELKHAEEILNFTNDIKKSQSYINSYVNAKRGYEVLGKKLAQQGITTREEFKVETQKLGQQRNQLPQYEQILKQLEQSAGSILEEMKQLGFKLEETDEGDDILELAKKLTDMFNDPNSNISNDQILRKVERIEKLKEKFIAKVFIVIVTENDEDKKAEAIKELVEVFAHVDVTIEYAKKKTQGIMDSIEKRFNDASKPTDGAGKELQGELMKYPKEMLIYFRHMTIEQVSNMGRINKEYKKLMFPEDIIQAKENCRHEIEVLKSRYKTTIEDAKKLELVKPYVMTYRKSMVELGRLSADGGASTEERAAYNNAYKQAARAIKTMKENGINSIIDYYTISAESKDKLSEVSQKHQILKEKIELLESVEEGMNQSVKQAPASNKK